MASSDSEVRKDIRLFSQIAFVTFGIMLWDVLRNISFGVSILRNGKRRVTSLLYFTLQICMLLHPLSLVIAVNDLTGITCGRVVWVSKVSGLFGVLGASSMFLLRTIEIWGRTVVVVGGLGLILLVQAGIWVYAVFPSERSEFSVEFCDFIRTDSKAMLLATYLYSSFTPLIFFGLSASKLISFGRAKTLRQLYLDEGVIYFLPATLISLIPAILTGLNRNPMFNVLGYPLCAPYPALCACIMYRAVTDLGPKAPMEGMPYRMSGYTRPPTDTAVVFRSYPMVADKADTSIPLSSPDEIELHWRNSKVAKPGEAPRILR